MKCLRAAVGCGLLLATAVYAQDEPATTKTGAEPTVAELIEQLDDERFVTREKATEALTKLGAMAVVAVGEAASDKRPEVSQRALKVLENILAKGDADGKTAAQKQLGELAKSDNPGVAKKAGSILEDRSKQPTSPYGRPGIRVLPGGGFIPGGGTISGSFEIRGIGGGSSVAITGDGKTIETTDGDRKIKIVDSKSDGITIKVTEKKGGKETTKEYKAADEKELKKKHPDGHKIYAKYGSGSGAGLIIRVVDGAIEIPKVVRPGTPRFGATPKEVKEMKERAGKLLEQRKRAGGTDEEKAKAAEKRLEALKELKARHAARLEELKKKQVESKE